MSQTQVFRVYIKASPEAIFEALTSAEWSERYGYRGRNEFELIKGGKYVGRATKEMTDNGAPAVMVEGEVLEYDPFTRFAHTQHFQWSPEIIDEGPSTVTYDIEPQQATGLTKLTVTHVGGPLHASAVAGEGALHEAGGGLPFIISDLKSLLECGKSLADA